MPLLFGDYILPEYRVTATADNSTSPFLQETKGSSSPRLPPRPENESHLFLLHYFLVVEDGGCRFYFAILVPSEGGVVCVVGLGVRLRQGALSFKRITQT